MIPDRFDYARAQSADHAIDLLASGPEDTKLLAGGQSLLPLMKLRLATPAMVVDVGGLSELSYVRDSGEHVAIGALTPHCEVAANSLLRRDAPLVAAAAAQVGDPQVRHRGTLGGSLCHADPAADLGAVLLAHEGVAVVRGPQGERQVALDELFVGYLETALREDEMLVEVRVPKRPECGWAFAKFTRRAIDWATVGVAVVRGADTRAVALVNMGATPLRARQVEEALTAGASDDEAADLAASGTNPTSDVRASADYRRTLAAVLTRRALGEASGRIGHSNN